VAQLARLDLNLLVILRELIRERNVTRASEAIVEAMWWCGDYDDDPAHRWLRQNHQMLAAEV
jgi:hypothetical protein